jgi:regulator of cell morphogenesis and NO signaling
VGENYVHAYVLHYFGIRFEEFPEHTLEEVCRQRGLRVEQVVKELENPEHLNQLELPLVSYPVDLVIEYLKHTHFLFIKHKLPYIARMVDSFHSPSEAFDAIEHDLRVVFPLFVEDFIHHIYEEEDTLFRYIKALDRASKGQYLPGRLFYLLEKYAIQKFAMEHEMHDDEMAGIRKITNDYTLGPDAPLSVRVIYHELKDFEKNLIIHARIENEILFPKAMALEAQVKQLFFGKAQFN